MKLIPKNIGKQIPKIGETSELSSNEVTVHVKLFNPSGAGTWYVTEFDGEDIAFGYVADMPYPELGYFSIKDLEGLVLWPNFRIERDKYFQACKLSEIMN